MQVEDEEEKRHQFSSGFPLPPPATHWERQPAVFNQYPHFCTLGQNLNLNQKENQIQTQTTSDGRRRNDKDLEPGRCKRTDGKKWRCSKAAVAPNHKYCDRHLNRGRTRRRSRKLVEHEPQPSSTTADLSNFSPIVSTSTIVSESAYPLFIDLLPTDDGDDAYFPSFSYPEPNSGMEVVASFEDEWNQLLLKDTGFMTAGLTYDCSVFRQDLETPTGFIETSQSTVSSDSSFSNYLTPSMAMASGPILDEEMGSIKTCLDIKVDQEEEEEDDGLKSIWSSVSDGGPLAEALLPCLPFWGSNPSSRVD